MIHVILCHVFFLLFESHNRPDYSTLKLKPPPLSVQSVFFIAHAVSILGRSRCRLHATFSFVRENCNCLSECKLDLHIYIGWSCIEIRNKIMKRHISLLPSSRRRAALRAAFHGVASTAHSAYQSSYK